MVSSPIVAVAGIGSAAEPAGNLQPSDVSVAGAAAPSASAADAASFARAASQVPEVQASQPSAAQLLGQDLAHRLDGFSATLQGWQRPNAAGHAQPAASAAEGASHAGPAGVMGDMVNQLQGVYAFAIQTTLASRGSTESTKVFNTLLKGQ